MPRKAKEEILIETETKDSKTTKVAASKAKTTTSKATEKKSTTAKAKATASKSATAKSAKVKETSASKEAATKKTSKSKSTTSTTKKSTTKKSSTKKTSTTKSSTTSKSKKVSHKRVLKSKAHTLKRPTPVVLEYYDLPYSYNKTVVKALAQNPNTIFVYWEISDEDRNNFIAQYGENFFNETKPVLVIHNLTDKYSYEIDINDFANNWYIHVNDTKCQYVIELARRPLEHIDTLSEDFLSITSSNVIESPNDHVLFFKDSDRVLFKNINTNQYTERIVKPFLKNILNIYDNYNLVIDNIENPDDEFVKFDFNNPSSQNPTSTGSKY